MFMYVNFRKKKVVSDIFFFFNNLLKKLRKTVRTRAEINVMIGEHTRCGMQPVNRRQLNDFQSNRSAEK